MSNLKLKLPLSDWLIAAGLFALALWLRASDLAHFVTADEHNWIFRSSQFLLALSNQDWAGTSVWYTPAVTTTWLGSASLAVYYKIHAATLNQPLAEWLAAFSRNKIDLEILLFLRWSIALFSSTMVVIVYGLARKLWALPVAILGTLFLLTEPHLLAVSRIIGHDVLITFFVTGSLLAFLYARKLRWSPTVPKSIGLSQGIAQYRWFVLSGIFAGLAILSKAPALILIPFAPLIAVSDTWLNKDRFKSWLQVLTAWNGVLLLSFILAWPAAWLDPLGQLWFVVSSAFLSSAGLEDADIQPYWSIPDPGFFYYLLNGAYKVSPFLMIGTVLAAVRARMLARQRLSVRDLADSSLFWLLLFTFLFVVMMTLGVKKSPRYILPAFPALAYVAAWGWLTVATAPWRPSLQRILKTGIIAVLGTLALLLSLNYSPYYFTYFNPLLGGAFTAPRLVRIGWGEGLDELGRWLSARTDAPAENIGVRYTATIYPFYQGEISSPLTEELDYVAFYIKQSQSGYPEPEILNYFKHRQPLHRVILNGIDYVQVYQGPGMTPIDQNGDRDSPLAYRPHTIYAPLGRQYRIELLWPDELSYPEGSTVKMELKSGDFVMESRVPLLFSGRNLKVSTHDFNIPTDSGRRNYTLLVDDIAVGEVKARLMHKPPHFRPSSTVMAGQLKLVGFRLLQQSNQLKLDLAWQSWPKASNDYTVFAQLLDDKGQRAAGVDVAPAQGFTTLDRKEVMLTHYDIPLADGLASGPYSLRVGLYYFAGNELINVGAVTLEDQVVLE